MRWIRRIVIVVLMLAPVRALAQECVVSSAPVSFGIYDGATGSHTDSIGEVVIRCDPGIPYTIKLNMGQNSGGLFIPRKLRLIANAAMLDYNLYIEPSLIEVWGDGTSNTSVWQGTGTGIDERVPVYGRIQGGQKKPAGQYSDSVTVTVEW